MASSIERWPLDKLIPYARNARTHSDEQVTQIAASITEFGFVNPILAGSDRVIIAGHARLLAARKVGLAEAPVIVLDGLTENQRRALVLADNKLALNAGWDDEMLRLEIEALKDADYDLNILGFEDEELARLLAAQEVSGGLTDEDSVPEPPVNPAAMLGDIWRLGEHRLICGDCTQPDVVARLLGDAKPILLVTDPPYGIELDSEWRDRAGLNGPQPGLSAKATKKARARGLAAGPAEPSYMKHRTAGHTETTISGDTRADWSEAFELVPSIQVAFVWHASSFTREVLNGLERIGFLYPQQIIWNKGRVVLTRTHYWYQHEPCWYVRKKRAPWYGKPGSENSTIWDSPSPKFIMGGSDEEKFDHPTQKPVELMRKPIRNHTTPGQLVYEPFC
jgi:DNA modification methylase